MCGGPSCVIMRAAVVLCLRSWRADNSVGVAGMREASFVHREVVVRKLEKLRCVWLFVGCLLVAVVSECDALIDSRNHVGLLHMLQWNDERFNRKVNAKSYSYRQS